MPLPPTFRLEPCRDNRRLGRLAATLGAVGILLIGSPTARADALADAGQLIKQGKYAQAQETLDKVLAQKPGDPQARFLKGIALTEQGKTDAAIAVFQKLTEEYPTLPEPYNNLAVIYAQQKQYDKAKAALETAIRTHPAYATAHENLGDIYARMATQAYDRALQLDSSNSSAQHKLALIRDLTASPTKIGKPAEPVKPVVVAAAPVVAPAIAPAAPPTTQAGAATSSATAPSPKPATVTEPPKPDPKPAAEPAKPTSEPAKPAADTAQLDHKVVANTVEGWASAWARKDVKTYLAAYGKEFKVPGGKPRSAWETERRQRIDKPGNIEIKVDRMKITVDGDRAVVQFRQGYRSGQLDINTNKRLDLVKRDGRWLIVQESVGG